MKSAEASGKLSNQTRNSKIGFVPYDCVLIHCYTKELNIAASSSAQHTSFFRLFLAWLTL
jgi:hypothetical protein